MSYPEDSTHVRKWVFSEEILNNLREAARTSALQKLQAIEASKPLKTPLQPLNSEEEQTVINWYSNVLFQYFEHSAANGHPIPYKIRYTAATYFRRFYAKQSVLEYDPQLVVGGCVFAALKIESNVESGYPLSLLSTVFRDFLHAELPILGKLDFNLVVIHMRNPLRRCGDLYREFCKIYQQEKDPNFVIPKQELGETVNKAELYSTQLAATDCGLLFSPSQLAFGLFLTMGRKYNLPLIEEFIRDFILEKFDRSINPPKQELSLTNNTPRVAVIETPTSDRLWAVADRVKMWVEQADIIFRMAKSPEIATKAKELYSRARRCFRLITPFVWEESSANPSSSNTSADVAAMKRQRQTAGEPDIAPEGKRVKVEQKTENSSGESFPVVITDPPAVEIKKENSQLGSEDNTISLD
eukprot:GDKJ01057202.1.p1 GENE.GDKJ01057202.1~~GDKJ01057202.1.p1  ORF type:complete len:423 (-),score=72.23 GDKJ01057202.1:45-1283(-)